MRGLKDSVRAEIKKPIVAGGDHHAIFFVSRIRALDNLTERGYVGGQPKAFALTESGRNLWTRLPARQVRSRAVQRHLTAGPCSQSRARETLRPLKVFIAAS